jgi:hypothetical protein
MKIEVNYIFREGNVDPLYERLGIDLDAEVEVEERGVLDLSEVVGASEFYELTQVYLRGGHIFFISLSFDEFKDTMDVVNKPAHYQGEIECIECIKASMTYEEFKGYLRGNSFKYLWRYNRKKNAMEDLQKAQWYLDRLQKEIDNNGKSL